MASYFKSVQNEIREGGKMRCGMPAFGPSDQVRCRKFRMRRRYMRQELKTFLLSPRGGEQNPNFYLHAHNHIPPVGIVFNLLRTW